ncbi:amino acid transporter AVT1J-like [Andrographis paniculata]|uniref:amino acid transporter AVT1J-like n=1 Tax=Andrographis paniculata TaxID=175694 RepID=UPI0021E8E55C|nr:amino acid transporter AVT1J-like [Andrographis paniculata]
MAASDHHQTPTLPLLIKFHDVEKGSSTVEPHTLNSTKTTSFLTTTFNGLNALSGVGILSVPYALSSGGWLSLILLFAIAGTTFYTGLLIKKCMEVDPDIRSYPDIGHKAFGPKGRLLVSIFMNLELYLVATGFLILAGDNLHNLLPDVRIDVFGIVINGRQSFVLLVALILTPTVLIDNMTTLSYISATGVFASVIILASILWSGMSEGIGFRHKGVLLNWSGLPTAFSLYAFCYCAHPVFPTLYTSMTNRRHFSGVLFVCFTFCTFAYVTTAVLGYLMFGGELQSQITLNLPTDRLSSKVAVYTALITPISKYGLMLKPIVETIESHFRSCCEKRFYGLFVKTGLVGSSVVVALTLPFFGSLMSLVGASLSVTASILLPCFCYLKISYRKIGIESAFIVFALLMGLVILVVGTYTSFLEIVHSL